MSVQARQYAPLVAAMVLAVTAAAPAHASLGARRASIDADVSHLKARLKSTVAGTYTLHELTGDGGMVTREFTNAAGTVFAVAWQGPVRPDLKTLFGGYFQRFQSDVQGAGRRHRALRADDIDFIVRTGGHPGDMWGFALVPGEVPPGFPMEALQ